MIGVVTMHELPPDSPTRKWSSVDNPVSGFQPLAAGSKGASLWGLGTYFARDAKYCGEGGFAKVHRCVIAGQNVVAKSIDISRLNRPTIRAILAR